MAQIRINISDKLAGEIKALKKLGVNWHQEAVEEIERIVARKRRVYMDNLALSLGIDVERKPVDLPGTPVLDEDAVRAIRSESASGVGYGALATKYGVSKSCIQQIVKWKTWRDVV